MDTESLSSTADLTAVFTGILATVASIAAIWQLTMMLWSGIQPRIVVHLIDGTKNRYSPDEDATLTFEFENVGGRTRVLHLKRKLMLREITIQIFLPKAFSLKEVKRHVSIVPRLGSTLFETSSASRYENEPYLYVFVPDPFERKPPMITSLADEETERCQVTVKEPQKKSGSYKILFDISTREGPLEQQKVFVTVEDSRRAS